MHKLQTLRPEPPDRGRCRSWWHPEADQSENSLRKKDRNCVIEAQAFFYDNDSSSFRCVTSWRLGLGDGHRFANWASDESRRLRDRTTRPKEFLHGLYVAPSKLTVNGPNNLADNAAPGTSNIWKLRLDGTGKYFTRLTHFNDYEGGKASNPVCRPTAASWRFRLRAQRTAGVGYGILLYWSL